MKRTETEKLIDQFENDPLALLAAIGGYYECQKSPEGKRLTPLVGYAAKYSTNDGKGLNYVGEIYANFSKAEERPLIMNHFTSRLWEEIHLHLDPRKINSNLVFVGPQLGGISVAQFLSLHASSVDARYACAEKKTVAVATETAREQTELFFGRHEIKKGDRVVISEDVLNNFSTTKQTIELIEKYEAEVICIAGLLNRSMTIDTHFEYGDKLIPVISLARKPYKEYHQNDSYVAEDILKGNVILKPKNEWSKLTEAVKKFSNVTNG